LISYSEFMVALQKEISLESDGAIAAPAVPATDSSPQSGSPILLDFYARLEQVKKHVYVYTCTVVDMYMCVRVYTYIYTCTCMRMCICVHMCMYIYAYTCVYVYIYIHTDRYTHMYVCVCMSVYVYECVCVCACCIMCM